ncbi:MAG: thioredoxin-like domain-containing protein [Pseudomonadales bacterium]
MNELLIAAVIILWILVLVLAAVVFALTRQVGILYERVAPAGALMVNQQLKAGDPAPTITIETLTGAKRTLGQTTSTAQLLFFLAPDCPICKSLLPILKSLQRAEHGVEILLLSDGEDTQPHRDMVAAESLEQFDYGLSELAGRQYGVSKLPYAVLIDGQNRIASLGIVNSREHLESLFEAQRLGVASIQDYLGSKQTPEPLFHDATAPATDQRGH